MRRASPLVLSLLLLSATGEAGDDFRATSDRRFEDPAVWSRVFDDPKRDAWQKPEALLRALEVRPGMVVADLGAGTGYFTPHLSRAVGPTGGVLAIEVEPSLVAHLRERAERDGAHNVTPILASRDRPRIPPASVDLLLVVDTYHHIDHRRDYFRRLVEAMRPGGRIAIVDWKPGDIPEGPREAGHKIPPATVVREMKASGWELVAQPGVLPHQYVLVFRPRDA